MISYIKCNLFQTNKTFKGTELCQEICRKVPINLLDKDYQCQCGPGRKPVGDGLCEEGKKIIYETFCETDEECEDEFPNSECGVKSCECKINHDLSEDQGWALGWVFTGFFDPNPKPRVLDWVLDRKF